jgi:hypothetical protein
MTKTTTQLSLALLTAAGLGLATTADAAPFTITYSFDGGLGAPIVTGAGAAGIDAGDFTAVGSATISSFGNDALISSDQTGFDEAAALADSDYFTFTIATSALAASNIDFESFSLLHTAQRGSQFDDDVFTHVVIQSTDTGFGTGNPTLTLPDSTVNNPGTSGDPANSVSETQTVSSIANTAYDSVSTMTFQVRVWDTRNDNTIRTRFDDIVLTGDVDVIPEPASIALLAAGGLCLLPRRRSAGR